jgi:cell division protein FtsL
MVLHHKYYTLIVIQSHPLVIQKSSKVIQNHSKSFKKLSKIIMLHLIVLLIILYINNTYRI